VKTTQRESVLRDYLYDHPEILFDRPVTHKQREVRIDGKFIDLLFEVEGVHHIVELKRDSITREAVGQVLEYYGRLRNMHPERKYKVVLAAPSIPKYRSIPLEEHGIRCVEIPFPTEFIPEPLATIPPLVEVSRVRSALNRISPLSDSENLSLDRVLLDRLLPPCAQSSVPVVHKLLLDAIPKVQMTFANYEVKPIAMVRANQPDILCIPSSSETQTFNFVRGGAWWAFAFGKSEHLAKNDAPNISVIANPWGLDFTINAELQTSQKSLIASIRRNPNRFDQIIENHGLLALQTWLKLEHQPRFYHWIPLTFKAVGDWNAAGLLSIYDNLASRYDGSREEWLMNIISSQLQLSESQAAHMKRTNRKPNLAIRLVKTLDVANPIWTQPYSEQRLTFEQEYIELRPLIEFFN
jgi:hypothetical protein